MIDLGAAAHFSAGAVGVPGERRFYIQTTTADADRWFLCEKAQVAALAEAGLELLERHDLGGVGSGLSAGFAPPGEVAWRVGQIAIELDDDTAMVVIILAPIEDDEESVRFEVSPAQMDAMAQEAVAAVASGRPTCPRCDLAMDPEGHTCPTTNGDLRGHRP